MQTFDWRPLRLAPLEADVISLRAHGENGSLPIHRALTDRGFLLSMRVHDDRESAVQDGSRVSRRMTGTKRYFTVRSRINRSAFVVSISGVAAVRVQR